MNKNIYIIRHCEAEGQSSDSSLTEKGFIQANELSDFLSYIKVDRVISSPYLRAIQTIKPFAKNKNIEIEMDSRLTERVLSSIFFSDWMNKLEATFNDMDLKYEGGESSNGAMNRIVDVVNGLWQVILKIRLSWLTEGLFLYYLITLIRILVLRNG